MAPLEFSDVVQARLHSDEKKHIKKVLRKNRDIYFNESHFIRVAVIKLLREYKRTGVKK